MNWESLKVIGYIVLVLSGTALVAFTQYRNNQKEEAKAILFCTLGPWGLALMSLSIMGIIQNYINEEYARIIFAPVFIIMLSLFVYIIQKTEFTLISYILYVKKKQLRVKQGD